MSGSVVIRGSATADEVAAVAAVFAALQSRERREPDSAGDDRYEQWRRQRALLIRPS